MAARVRSPADGNAGAAHPLVGQEGSIAAEVQGLQLRLASRGEQELSMIALDEHPDLAVRRVPRES